MALQFENNSFGPGNQKKATGPANGPNVDNRKKKSKDPLKNAFGMGASEPMGGMQMDAPEMDFGMGDMGGMQMNAPSPTGGSYEAQQQARLAIDGKQPSGFQGKLRDDTAPTPKTTAGGGIFGMNSMGAQPTGVAGFSGAVSPPYTTDPSTGPNVRYWDDPQPSSETFVDPDRGFINRPAQEGDIVPGMDYGFGSSGRSGIVAGGEPVGSGPYQPIDWPTDGDGRKMLMPVPGRDKHQPLSGWETGPYGEDPTLPGPRPGEGGDETLPPWSGDPILGMRGGQQGQQGGQPDMGGGLGDPLSAALGGPQSDFTEGSVASPNMDSLPMTSQFGQEGVPSDSDYASWYEEEGPGADLGQTAGIVAGDENPWDEGMPATEPPISQPPVSEGGGIIAHPNSKKKDGTRWGDDTPERWLSQGYTKDPETGEWTHPSDKAGTAPKVSRPQPDWMKGLIPEGTPESRRAEEMREGHRKALYDSNKTDVNRVPDERSQWKKGDLTDEQIGWAAANGKYFGGVSYPLNADADKMLPKDKEEWILKMKKMQGLLGRLGNRPKLFFPSSYIPNQLEQKAGKTWQDRPEYKKKLDESISAREEWDREYKKIWGWESTDGIREYTPGGKPVFSEGVQRRKDIEEKNKGDALKEVSDTKKELLKGEDLGDYLDRMEKAGLGTREEISARLQEQAEKEVARKKDGSKLETDSEFKERTGWERKKAFQKVGNAAYEKDEDAPAEVTTKDKFSRESVSPTERGQRRKDTMSEEELDNMYPARKFGKAKPLSTSATGGKFGAEIDKLFEGQPVEKWKEIIEGLGLEETGAQGKSSLMNALFNQKHAEALRGEADPKWANYEKKLKGSGTDYQRWTPGRDDVAKKAVAPKGIDLSEKHKEKAWAREAERKAKETRPRQQYQDDLRSVSRPPEQEQWRKDADAQRESNIEIYKKQGWVQNPQTGEWEEPKSPVISKPPTGREPAWEGWGSISPDRKEPLYEKYGKDRVEEYVKENNGNIPPFAEWDKEIQDKPAEKKPEQVTVDGEQYWNMSDRGKPGVPEWGMFTDGRGNVMGIDPPAPREDKPALEEFKDKVDAGEVSDEDILPGGEVVEESARRARERELADREIESGPPEADADSGEDKTTLLGDGKDLSSPEISTPPESSDVIGLTNKEKRERKKIEKRERDDYNLAPELEGVPLDVLQDTEGNIDYGGNMIVSNAGGLTKADMRRRGVKPSQIQALVNNQIAQNWGKYNQAAGGTGLQAQQGMNIDKGTYAQRGISPLVQAMLGSRKAQFDIPWQYAMQHAGQVRDRRELAHQLGLQELGMTQGDFYADADDRLAREAVDRQLLNSIYNTNAFTWNT